MRWFRIRKSRLDPSGGWRDRGILPPHTQQKTIWLTWVRRYRLSNQSCWVSACSARRVDHSWRLGDEIGQVKNAACRCGIRGTLRLKINQNSRFFQRFKRDQGSDESISLTIQMQIEKTTKNLGRKWKNLKTFVQKHTRRSILFNPRIDKMMELTGVRGDESSRRLQ